MFRRLGQIEEGLGVKLFERHRTGYALTPAGEEMTSLAERMEEDVATFARKLAGQAVSPGGELRVTTNDTLLVHLLTPLFARFAKACPDVRLDVVLDQPGPEPLEARCGRGDPGDRQSARNPGRPSRGVDRLGDLRATRRISRMPAAIDLIDLYDRPWVALADNLAALKAARFVRDRVAPERIVYKVNTVLGLAEAVESGIGVGPLPCFIADVRPSLVRLTPPNPDFAAGLWLLTHPDLRQSARVRAFMDFMAAEIAKQRRMIEGPEAPTEEKRKAS